MFNFHFRLNFSGVFLEGTALNGGLNGEFSFDPLSSSGVNEKTKSEKIVNSLKSEPDLPKYVDPTIDGFEPWSTKKTAILQKYTTNEKLTLVTSFLSCGVPVHTQVAVENVVKMK